MEPLVSIWKISKISSPLSVRVLDFLVLLVMLSLVNSIALAMELKPSIENKLSKLSLTSPTTPSTSFNIKARSTVTDTPNLNTLKKDPMADSITEDILTTDLKVLKDLKKKEENKDMKEEVIMKEEEIRRDTTEDGLKKDVKEKKMVREEVTMKEEEMRKDMKEENTDVEDGVKKKVKDMNSAIIDLEGSEDTSKTSLSVDVLEVNNPNPNLKSNPSLSLNHLRTFLKTKLELFRSNRL